MKIITFDTHLCIVHKMVHSFMVFNLFCGHLTMKLNIYTSYIPNIDLNLSMPSSSCVVSNFQNVVLKYTIEIVRTLEL